MKERRCTRKLLSLSLALALTLPVLPTAQAQGEKQALYAADGRMVLVDPGDVATYTAVGWYTEPQAFVAEDAGSDGSVFWRYGSGRLEARGTGGMEHQDASWLSHKKEIRTLYVGRGVDIPSWTFDDCSSLSRVELPDTLTTLHSYAFRGCALERVGIPESVTYVDIFAWDNTYAPTKNPSCRNKNMVIYAVPGSEAQKYADRNDIPWVAASQVFSPGGLTCMVTDEELPYYLANGWFPYPVTTVYSPDGSAILIAENELAAYEATGWSADKYTYYTPMYALDGRIVDILNSQVEAYKAVGWYDHTGYICAKADQNVWQYGYASAVSYVETIMELTDQSDPAYWTFFAKRNDLCAQWRQSIGSPIAVLGYSISHNAIGVPVVNMNLRNLTPAACGSLEVKFTCMDAYGNVTADYPWLYDGTFTGYADTASIPAYGTKTFAWTLYSNERTTSVRNAYALRAVFADGSVWGR